MERGENSDGFFCSWKEEAKIFHQNLYHLDQCNGGDGGVTILSFVKLYQFTNPSNWMIYMQQKK